MSSQRRASAKRRGDCETKNEFNFFGQNVRVHRSRKGRPDSGLSPSLSFCTRGDDVFFGFLRIFLSPLAGGAGLGSIHSRGRLGGRARAKGARRDKAAAADQEAGYGSLHAP